MQKPQTKEVKNPKEIKPSEAVAMGVDSSTVLKLGERREKKKKSLEQPVLEAACLGDPASHI